MVNDGNETGASDYNGSTVSTGANSGKKSSVGRRNFLKAAGAGAFVTTAAGCLGGGGGGGGSDPLSERDEVTVGVLAPVPSENPIGASIANGVRLSAQQINEDGGLGENGAEVNVVVKDTQESPQTGANRYGELIRDENVDMTTGVFTSEVLLRLMDSIAESQVPHITAGAATPEASAQVNSSYSDYKYHFRAGPINAHNLGENLVDFIEAKSDDLGWESVYVLVEDYKWTEPVSTVLDESLSDAGVEVAGRTRYASGTEDFGPIYGDVEDSGADAALISMAHTGTAAVLQWARSGKPFEFGGIHVPMQLPSYFAAVEGACNLGTTQNSATPNAEVTTSDEVDRGLATIPFSNAFREEYDSYPVYTGYISYDAMNQYATVVEENDDVGADAVVSGLESSSYTGTVGTIEYYGKDNEFAHDVKYDPELVYPLYAQWQSEGGEGVQQVIWPDDVATGEYQNL